MKTSAYDIWTFFFQKMYSQGTAFCYANDMHVYTPDTRAAYAARELAIVLRAINFDLWPLATWIGGAYLQF